MNSISQLPNVFVLLLKEQNPQSVTFDYKVGKDWYQCKAVFEQDKKTISEIKLRKLGPDYKTYGTLLSELVQETSEQNDAKAILCVVKAFNSLTGEVIPNLSEAHQIMVEDGFPVEEAEKACA